MIWLGLGFFCFGSLLVYSLINGIGPVPTSSAVLKTVLELVPPFEVGSDLVSGWGGLGLAVSDTSAVTGFETSPLPYLYSRLRPKAIKTPNWRPRRCNFFKESLSDYDLILCYLYPKAMTKLAPKLKKELKSGSHVISHTFALPGFTPLRTLYAPDLYNTPVYLYRID